MDLPPSFQKKKKYIKQFIVTIWFKALWLNIMSRHSIQEKVDKGSVFARAVHLFSVVLIDQSLNGSVMMKKVYLIPIIERLLHI